MVKGRSPGIAAGIMILETQTETQGAAVDARWEPLAAIQNATDKAVTAVTHLTDQAVSQVTDQVQTSLVDQTVRKAESLGNSVIDSLIQRSSIALESWVSQHRIAGWLVTHPLWSLAALVLSISLIWTLVTLAGQLLRRTWLVILGAPFIGLWWVVRWIAQRIRQAIAQPEPSTIETASEDRITAILLRLEHLRQEQDALMQELTSLIEPDQVREKEPR